MSLRYWIEEYAPAALAAVAGLVWCRFGIDWPSLIAKDLLMALLSASAIAAGFMATAMSILMPLGASDVGRRLKRRNKLVALFSCLKRATYSCLFVALLSIGSMFFLTESVGLPRNIGAFVLASVTYAGASLVIVVQIIVVILEALSIPADEDFDG